MTTRLRRHVEALDTFWADYLRTLCQASPAAAPVGPQLDLLFGNLTRHEVEPSPRLPLTIRCSDCRNNRGARRDSVCSTHVGAVRGTLEARQGVPLEVDYEPSEEGSCRMIVAIAGTRDGRPVVALAQRADHVALGSDGLAHWADDRRAGVRVPITPLSWAILQAAAQPISVAAAAARLGVEAGAVAQVLDQLHRCGWVRTTFEPDSPTS
ncbi:MAG TPA: helix-turn-helix domain-containing protein [Polyangiaceae bacterium]|nr:helix-turn-helix domain-containing protein [Polyangiaceae bacterium]